MGSSSQTASSCRYFFLVFDEISIGRFFFHVGFSADVDFTFRSWIDRGARQTGLKQIFFCVRVGLRHLDCRIAGRSIDRDEVYLFTSIYIYIQASMRVQHCIFGQVFLILQATTSCVSFSHLWSCKGVTIGQWMSVVYALSYVPFLGRRQLMSW